MPLTSLNAQQRSDDLRDMAEHPVDVLVIGGGITGAGIALDAATRGLSTAIIDAQDWAQGTSSRSSKLVHGGLRYLQQLNFALVAEALKERDLLMHRIAPHLVKPIQFMYPLVHKGWERPFVATGIGMYDALAHVGAKGESMPLQRHLSAQGVRRTFPSLKDDAAVGAIVYWDGRVDDARLTLDLVRTAQRYGALAANRAAARKLVRDETGRVVGALVEDITTGETREVRAKAVISAAGVWTEPVQDLAESKTGLKVLASKGIHIVVPKERLSGTTGLILQTEKSVLFIIPWDDYWVIGTTDTPYERDLVTPTANAADVEYVLEHANAVLRDPLTVDDVIGTWAGLRPLVQPGTKGEETPSTKISREHSVVESAPGLFAIAGGKLTTYRVMAKDAVDAALGKKAAKRLPSITDEVALLGAQGWSGLMNQAEHLSRRTGVDQVVIERLLNRYGDETLEMLDAVAEHPELGEPVEGAPRYLAVEIHRAATHEGALDLEDVICRRTHLNYDQRDGGLGAAPAIARIMGEVLGWDEAEQARQVELYTQLHEAERAALRETDENRAQQLRAGAGDPYPRRG
ncbi:MULTISPECIES: glycerol-3-phosphate dehydrogenase/oxidase [unclassified Kocuria]|uniref:glycerol-3-phosphate dehydrogenase/oxidase n=1 Tax=unclassified Kocuria TaxID=2649579 RepID=UPI000F863615|nr:MULTISPECIES: glycerol-3-phosphate dehydrogenase/oxidase [unclassified Kocuria]RUP80704.1 glycerol-3-phosphate dehydrogenase/oxidase [Kocuria sp. HSID17590]RUQ04223.1 glycerol-3-phosphate dehydrogenase/oxidase [Kocuria sp. HSID17582]